MCKRKQQTGFIYNDTVSVGMGSPPDRRAVAFEITQRQFRERAVQLILERILTIEKSMSLAAWVRTALRRLMADKWQDRESCRMIGALFPEAHVGAFDLNGAEKLPLLRGATKKKTEGCADRHSPS